MTSPRYSSINSRGRGPRRYNVPPMAVSLQPAEEKELMVAEEPREKEEERAKVKGRKRERESERENEKKR